MEQTTARELRRRARTTQAVYDGLVFGLLGYGAMVDQWPAWLTCVLVVAAAVGSFAAYRWATAPTWKLQEKRRWAEGSNR